MQWDGKYYVMKLHAGGKSFNMFDQIFQPKATQKQVFDDAVAPAMQRWLGAENE